MKNHHPLVSPGADLMQAARIMASNGAYVLPVVQNGKFLGLLTLDDLIRKEPPAAAMFLARSRQVN